MRKSISIFIFIAVIAVLGTVSTAFASHSWGNYHWARSSNPLVLKLGNNLTTSAWVNSLKTASTDWNASTVLNTIVVDGQGGRNCKTGNGRVEVCNNRYGNNGWLGIAQIWASGQHITQGLVKMNDTYFNTPTYNTPAWRQFVVCQEVGHIFGLDHQDEIFNNPNLGTCMDYTNVPAGGNVGNLNYGVSNLRPNTHDFIQLEEIYSHLETASTLPPKKNRGNAEVDLDNPSAWGKEISKSSDKKTTLYERDLGKGDKVFTFVIWAE